MADAPTLDPWSMEFGEVQVRVSEIAVPTQCSKQVERQKSVPLLKF